MTNYCTVLFLNTCIYDISSRESIIHEGLPQFSMDHKEIHFMSFDLTSRNKYKSLGQLQEGQKPVRKNYMINYSCTILFLITCI